MTCAIRLPPASLTHDAGSKFPGPSQAAPNLEGAPETGVQHAQCMGHI